MIHDEENGGDLHRPYLGPPDNPCWVSEDFIGLLDGDGFFVEPVPQGGISHSASVPWQIAYILAPVFGWVQRDDQDRWVRVVRSLYVDIPRKNGKSTLCGGIGLYLMGADSEPGAQVLAAATTAEQASYVFGPIKQLVASSPALKKHMRPLARRILHQDTGSHFTVVSSVAEALHGANVHGAIIDELHVHRNGDLVETIETGTGSRRQPLVAIIITADDGRSDTIYARKRQRI